MTYNTFERDIFSTEPNQEVDLRIKVQAEVIARLGLGTDEKEILNRYVDEGYAQECRRLMLEDEEVMELLEQKDENGLANLLTEKLKAWASDSTLEEDHRLAA